MSCSIARTVDVVGEWWTPLILRDLFLGVVRYDDLRSDLGIATNTLADRLARLTSGGIVERRLYQERPRRYEYGLTPKGRELFPVLLALMRWGDRWTAGRSGVPAVLRHADCGRKTQPVAACEHCGGVLRMDNVSAHPGPGARAGPGTRLLAVRLRAAGAVATGRKASSAATATEAP